MNMNPVVARSRREFVAFSILAAMLVSQSAASVEPQALTGTRPDLPESPGQTATPFQRKEMLARISEIEIHASHLAEYRPTLKEEAEASVRLEPGVVAIFPMYQKENPMQVRILEIYASREAYEAHLKTPHFQKYKTTTLKMVKSLRLVDMEVMDAEAMTQIFRKMNKR